MVNTSEGNFVCVQFRFSYCYINNLYNLIVHETGTCLSDMTMMNELGIISMYASDESVI